MARLAPFTVGQTVRLHLDPYSYLGEVTKVGRKYVWVLLWAVGETRACLPEELTVADLGSADG